MTEIVLLYIRLITYPLLMYSLAIMVTCKDTQKSIRRSFIGLIVLLGVLFTLALTTLIGYNDLHILIRTYALTPILITITVAIWINLLREQHQQVYKATTELDKLVNGNSGNLLT